MGGTKDPFLASSIHDEILTYAQMAFLDIDVLLCIMSICDDTAISKMMKTCHEMYNKGARYLLDQTVILATEKQVRSFVLFMPAEGNKRFAYLRSLCLIFRSISRPNALMLGGLLEDHSGDIVIRDLTILHAEDVFNSCFTLANALASLTNIVTLDLRNVGRLGAHFLRELRSSLKCANIHVSPLSEHGEMDEEEDDDDDDDDGYYRNPIELLGNSQRTLETLVGENFETIFGEPMYKVYYPHVRRLELRDNEIPTTVLLAKAFPNVSFLRVMTAEKDLDEFLGEELAPYAERRSVNIVEQLRYGTWTSLGMYSGTLMDHFMLGIQCPIAELDIEGPFMEPFVLRPVLKDARPYKVTFKKFDGGIFTPDFAKVMRRPYVSQLKCLEFVIILGVVPLEGAAMLVRAIFLHIDCSSRR